MATENDRAWARYTAAAELKALAIGSAVNGSNCPDYYQLQSEFGLYDSALIMHLFLLLPGHKQGIILEHLSECHKRQNGI
jgi:hypothetical protein